VFAAALLIAGTLLLAGCPERTTIEHINRSPGHYAGKEVTIAGRVSNSFGALGTGVFELQDETGRMWVFSERYGVPGRDARIAVATPPRSMPGIVSIVARATSPLREPGSVGRPVRGSVIVGFPCRKIVSVLSRYSLPLA